MSGAKLRLFDWDVIAGSNSARPNLGDQMPVAVYRLALFSLHDTLCEQVGDDKAHEYLREAGLRVGIAMAKNALDLTTAPSAFISQLQKTLKEYKIGILRIEDVDMDSGRFVLAVDEDVDCSGLPLMSDSVCYYDEGFIAGILEAYTGKPYDAREVDCWTTGARVCRFEAAPKG